MIHYKYTVHFVECLHCLVTCRKFGGKTVYKHEFALNLTLSMGTMKSVAFVMRLAIDLLFFSIFKMLAVCHMCNSYKPVMCHAETNPG